MKVYKMNECDWMAANSENEAIEKYENITSCDISDLDVKICELTDQIWYGFEYKELENFLENRDGEYKIRKDNRGDYPIVLYLQFSEVLELDKTNQPYIIASTEF